MALIPKYTLVCDEVRREDNGKLIVIGMYTPGIRLQKLPGKLARLVFFTYFEVTTPGVWEITYKFSHRETGAVAGAPGKGRIEVPVSQQIQPGTGAVIPFVVNEVTFQMDGVYVFTAIGANFDGISVEVPVSLQAGAVVH